jgi:hypothetical protein
MSFIFGGNTPWTAEDLKKKREIAEALALANTQTPRNVGEGLNAIGRALAFRGINRRASKEEARLRGEFESKWNTAFGGGGGGAYAGGGGGGSPSGTWTPAPPPPSPVDVAAQGMPVAQSGGLTFGADMPKADPGMIGGGKEPLDFGAAVMTPQEMLIEGAKRRGLDPIDVATAISYETGGKFDPMIAGPTTQWGTHRGLIQFGEPQAKQHGVDFSSPDAAWRSQLNPETGAIWSYLDGAGVKPGMGLPEIYSGINAGSVGRMNASDANNGGAPGTVADKVASMGPHREKAAQFLGGTWTPDPNYQGGGGSGGGVAFAGGGGGGAGGFDIGSLVALASDPMASPQRQAVVNALIQQQLQMMDPAYQMRLEKERLELAQMQNPTEKPPETLIERQALLEAAGIDPNTPEGQTYILTGKLPEEGGGKPASYGTTLQFFTGQDGKLRAGVIGNDGTFKEVPPPDGGDWAQGVEKVDVGTKWVFYDKRTGEKVGEEPKDLRGAEAEKAIGQAEGEAAGDAVTGLGNALAKGEQAIALIDQITNDPALPSILGIVQGNLPAGTPIIGGGQAGADIDAKVQQLQGQVFLEAFESLKGAGQITEIEGQKAERAKARLQRTQSPEAFKAALAELREVIESGMRRAQEKAGNAAGVGVEFGLSEDDLKYLEQP